ncbi:MAG: baseplate J/gp47 family protein, partial [Nitrososphaeraceae archaeon]|nr:baseplate J/gp47 family protein [Nitrososphaeraceae archaeon]
VLPNVPLDPRNEADLVIAAAQKIYEASNGRLNNFSPSSPTMALIEGQAYAGAELLYYANQLPEAIILEWLSQLLGIQRRLGTPSKSTLEVNIAPHADTWILKAGFIVRSNTSITGEEEVLFTTDSDLIIPPQQSQGFVNITSINVGSDTNLDTEVITEFEESLAFLRSVRNITPATGGTDEEDLTEVKQRAFSYIRRRNPVSKQDWIDYVTGLLGTGSIVLVKNRRPEIERQNDDALTSANHVSFFMLGPNKEVLSNAQLSAVKEKIDSHLPLNVQAHVYNINTQNVDIYLTVSYNPARRGSSLKTFSEEIYNSFIDYLSPNNYFDMGEPIQIWDLITLFSKDYAYVSPNIESLTCYSAPQNLSIIGQWKDWKTGEIYLEDELISSGGLFYRVVQNFDPTGTDPIDQVNDGILQFNRVKDWLDFPHRLNDIVIESGNYYLILDNIAGTDPIIGNNITAGKVSAAKTPVTWTAGIDLVAGDFVYSKDEGDNIITNEMYLVKQAVTVINTGTIASAESSGFITQITPVALVQGSSYTTGEYVYLTNVLGSFDYYKVLNDFTYNTLSSPFQEIYNGNLIKVIVHTTTPSTFRGRKYKARFRTREYLELTDNGIYQVGIDFTPDDSTIVQMIADRRLYQTEYSTNPDKGSIATFNPINFGGGYSIELNDETITTANIDDIVTDGSGESVVLSLDLNRGRFEIGGLNILSPGADYAPGDLITIPARLNADMELDRPIYLEVDTIDVNGGITGLIETEFQEASITYLRRWGLVVDVISYSIDSQGTGAQFRCDAVFDGPYSYRGFLNNITISDSGDGYAPDELLYIDFDSEPLLTYITNLTDSDLQIRINTIVANLPFTYRKFYKIEKGDIVNYNDFYYTAVKNFTPVINGGDFYINNETLVLLESPTQAQKDSSIGLFDTPIVNNIPTPLLSLPGLVTFDNKAAIYSTTTNAFDGNNGTFWGSRELGSAVTDTSYIGVDLGFNAYITSINFTNATSVNPLNPTTASFDIQFSVKGPDGPWITIATGTNSESVQSFTELDIQARYWRFIANGANVPDVEQQWRIANIELFGDINNEVERYEDIILYTDNNTTAFYRAMKTFTPPNNTEPREYELNSQLLKVVNKYENEQYILPRNDFSGLDPGWMYLKFHPHGQPEQITTYVIENKIGSNLVYSIEPGNSSGPIVDYKNGTFAL